MYKAIKLTLFPSFALFYRNFNFCILGVYLTEKMRNIDGNER